MKKLLFLFLTIPFLGFAQIQKDTTKLWKLGGATSLNLSQVSLTNWAAGGKSSASGTFLFNTYANYTKDKISWENTLDLGYGLLKEEEDDWEKTDDEIELTSKLGLKATEKLYYTLLFDFQTQLSNGYNYSTNPDSAISAFMAPAYFKLALGIDYKPNDKISIFVSPLTNKLTVVADEILSDAGAFGVDPGEKTLWELGFYFKTQYKAEILKNVTLDTQFDLFSNYLDRPQNIDISWDVKINMKINDYLSTNITTNMIYDDDVKIEDEDGTSGSRLQFKEVLGVGLSLKF